MSETVCCLHGYASGRVQGVCYRQFTQTEAMALGITGWVRNLPDGRVEFMACGPAASLDRLLACLQAGPPRAAVTSVDTRETVMASFHGFSILR